LQAIHNFFTFWSDIFNPQKAAEKNQTQKIEKHLLFRFYIDIIHEMLWLYKKTKPIILSKKIQKQIVFAYFTFF